MIFCPKCSAVLVPKKEGKKMGMSCFCGYSSKGREKLILNEEVKLSKEDKIEIIDKKIEVLPKTNEEECPKCHHIGAYYWLVQTRASDEAATRFFKCIKCNYTWRSYS